MIFSTFVVKSKQLSERFLLYFASGGFVIQWENGLGGSGGYERIFFLSLPTHFFDDEQICEVAKGGVLIMKPLIWHSSKRTENQQKRRVIHLEFSNLELPKPLIWAETIF